MTGDFEDMETDEELLGSIADATLAKDTLAGDIRKKVRVIRNMADLQYNGVGKYGSFGFEDMANMSDNELYRLAKRVVRVTTKLAGELGLQGLTPADISGLSTAAGLFDH